MEDKCLPVDVEFFKSISELNSVQAYNRTLQQFVTLLNNHMKTGLLSLRRRVIFSRRSFADRSPVFPPRTPDWKNAKNDERRGGVGEARKKSGGRYRHTRWTSVFASFFPLMSVFLKQHDSLQIFPVFQHYQTSVRFLLLGWTRLIRLLKSL
jgi:hypothetical protein